jgi:hypothetical protein
MTTRKRTFLLILLFIFISILFFTAGSRFGEWGGYNRFTPYVINWIRNNILGDQTVLDMEKRVFSMSDYLKQTWNNSADETVDRVEYDVRDDVALLADSYYTDHAAFNQSDYDTIKLLHDNWYPNLKTIFPEPIKNEGIWNKYLLSPETFRPLYAETMLRSDPERKYVKVFIYKFDMDRLELEFVPGGKDVKGREDITGEITPEQRKRAMWIFSGGFQYKHGKYGMKWNDEVLLPPREGAATLKFYRDGSIDIVEWPADQTDDPETYAWRQNELPLVIDGEVTPKISRLWGLTPKDVHPILTIRSGLGLTDDGQLVFAFGDDLSAGSLATAMIAAGVQTGMHLDMNHFNVHFVTSKINNRGYMETSNVNDILSFYKNIYTVYSPRDYFILGPKR